MKQSLEVSGPCRRCGTVRAAVWCVALLVLASCKPKPAEPPLRELTLALSWIHQAQFSGPYYADQHGLYAKEGLRVGFVPAAVDHDPLGDFVAGKHDFVLAQPTSLILARLEGHRVKAVAAIYRIDPFVFLALESSGIKTPQDFRGKTVALAYAEKPLFMALLKKVGVDPGEVTVVLRDWYDFEKLKKGEVDVQSGWLIDQYPAGLRQGLKLDVISPYDYGITFYADVLVARESLIEEEPELVEKFVRATLRGWAEALQAPAESAKLPLRYAPKLDLVHEREVLEYSAPLIHTGLHRIGWMRVEDWQEMLRVLHSEGVISEKPDPGELYTTRFLEAAPPQ